MKGKGEGALSLCNVKTMESPSPSSGDAKVNGNAMEVAQKGGRVGWELGLVTSHSCSCCFKNLDLGGGEEGLLLHG